MKWVVVLLVFSCAPVEPAAAQSCSVGETKACSCGALTGQQTCLTARAQWSACGCARDGGSDVALPPAPPPTTSCGATQCAPYAEEDTEVGAKGCCTTGGVCGSSSDFLFGTACVPRGGAVGTHTSGCPDESVNFVDMNGCCRPDGQCGLSIDDVPNFDLGCVERTEMARLLNQGARARDTLSAVFLMPVRPASFAASRCTP
jgi:hypothetical protein